MENLKSRGLSMPVTFQQIVQPNVVQQNAYYDLMPVTSNACRTSACSNDGNNVGGGEGFQIHHQTDFDLTAEMLVTLKERKLLGKRKSCHRRDFDEESSRDDKSSLKTNYGKKQNHSEIEKRRRDKMNAYITELATMVPVCHTNARKLDKLTVLRMAVQHLRSIRGNAHSYAEDHYKPAFLSDEELKHLILQAADGFLFVVGCDRGRILFVSESVSQILNYSQSDLLGQSWFDILHPKDVAKVKEQLSSPDLSPKERLVDSKTLLPVKADMFQSMTRLCPGARRSFLCRMKRRALFQVKKENETIPDCHKSLKKEQGSDKSYTVIQCIGYLKSWSPAKLGLEETEGENDGEVCDLSCLVAVGRIQSQYTGRHCLPFVSRHAIDGTFLFVDQRATLMLGFLPQELVGTNVYEYFHEEDIHTLSETHKVALQSQQVTKTQSYRLRTKDGSYVRIQSEWKPFRNPWTKDIEYFISKNSVILPDSLSISENGVDREDGFAQPSYNDTFLFKSGMNNAQKIFNSNAGVDHGSQQMVLEGVVKKKETNPTVCTQTPLKNLDNGIRNFLTCAELKVSSSSIDKGGRSNSIMQTINPDEVMGSTSCSHKNALSGVLNSSTVDSSVSSDADILDIMNGTIMNQADHQSNINEGNDEAAMAVIMSLLEADPGLGASVDFQGLNWPLS